MNIPIHVMHIASGDLWAGAEMQLYTLASSQLNSPDIRVSAVLMNDAELAVRLRGLGVDVTVIDESDHNGLQILLKMRAAICDSRPDIIHTHRLKENILGSLAALSCGNIPSLRTAHGAQEHHLPWYKLAHHAQQWLNGFCGRYIQKAIVAVSDDLGEQLSNRLPADRIKVIQNGIDCSSIKASHEVQGYQHDINIGIVGRLTPVKRIDLFLQAAARVLTQSSEDICFHVIGDGPLSDDMKRLAGNLGIAAKVRFHGHREDVYDHIAHLDVLMMTSDHEGLPMTILEAMVLRTPVICHAVGGLPTVLDHGHCGVLVTRHDDTGYADALLQLIDDREILGNLQDAAFERVSTCYDSVNNAAQYASLYRRLLQR